jgi:threonine synthase
MDISKASNFERFIFDLLKHDARTVKHLFAEELVQTSKFSLSSHPLFIDAKAHYGFLSGKSTHEDRLKTIRHVHKTMGELIDPHTADGLKVALEHHSPDVPMLVLETALPIKFAETIHAAIGVEPKCPEAFSELQSLPQFVSVMPADLASLKNFLVTRLNEDALS